jgi:hypothetical protein
MLETSISPRVQGLDDSLFVEQRRMDERGKNSHVQSYDVASDLIFVRVMYHLHYDNICHGTESRSSLASTRAMSGSQNLYPTYQRIIIHKRTTKINGDFCHVIIIIIF